MRLGYIDYLNCYPFYFHMFERKPLEGIRIIPGYPAALNRMMSEHDLDMSPISAATCADIADEIVVLPKFCLSSVGYVGSVTLASRVPIEDLHERKVGLTKASHTSIVLLKILLQRYYGLAPVYHETEPGPHIGDHDAVLIIGNDALIRGEEPVQYMYDLGDLWLRKTGFPVVFAMFAVRKELIDKYAWEIRTVISSYDHSLRYLTMERENVIGGARRTYPNIAYDIGRYYNSLQFEFTDQLQQALDFYFTLGSDVGLLNKVTELEFFNF